MDFNTLSNKQLREVCLQHGLPNVPVTDSSRSILIKRLNAIMAGTEGKTKKSTAPKKATSPTNRRKTVHSTTTTTVSSGDEADFAVNKNHTTTASNRRTVAPLSHDVRNANIPKQPPKQRNIPVEVENRTSYSKINTYAAPLISEPPQNRRSVSLSKTGVLTTSYSQETAPLHTYEDEVENNFEEMEDEIDDVEMESLPDTDNIYSKQFNIANNNNLTNYNRTNYAHPITPTAPPSPPTITTPKLYPNLQDTILQTQYDSAEGIRASHSSTAARQSTLGFVYNPATSYVPSPQIASNANRQTIGGYGFDSGISTSSTLKTSSPYSSPTTKRYSVATKRHTARAIDNDDVGASSSDDQYEAPYLSKFSRNLDQLKTEPLLQRTSNSYDTTTTTSKLQHRYSNYSPAAPKRRRGAYEDENGVTFGQFWTTLEQKYHLKQAFLLISCFLVAVFIYVFFLQ